MKTIIQTIIRYKSSTLLNIIGLSTAFAAFLLVGMQIRYELTYDRGYNDQESIYALCTQDTTTGIYSMAYNRAIPIVVKGQVAEIEALSVYDNLPTSRVYTVSDSGGKLEQFIEEIYTCDEDFVDIFYLNFIMGDPRALSDPASAIISDQFAQRAFGNESPLGKQIECGDERFTISAVYRDFADNSHVKPNILVNVDERCLTYTNAFNYQVYVKLKVESDPELVDDKISPICEKLFTDTGFFENETSELVEIADIRSCCLGYDNSMIWYLVLCAVMIIMVAYINFMNFEIAMIPMKIKSINLRKVVGASVSELCIGMVWHTVVIVVISFSLSLLIVQLFKISPLNGIISDTSFAANHLVYIIAAIVVILIGIVSGLYPAIYSTSFQPSIILKSNFGVSTVGRSFRNILIGAQFFIALAFIASAMFIQQQYNHFISQDGGYIKEGILHINHGDSFTNYYILRDKLMKNPQIVDVTYSAYPLGGEENNLQNWGDETINALQVNEVDHNFLTFFGIEILEGRDFREEDRKKQTTSLDELFILNRLGADIYKKKIGDYIFEDYKVVGVCENIKLTCLKSESKPFAFLTTTGYLPLQESYIKVSGNHKDITTYIREAYREIDPLINIEINLFSESLEAEYGSESKMKSIMQSLSLIAIIIALVGVFGLVSFDTRYRCKEIGLRRINGATVGNILRMFSMSYIKILLVSFCLSVPAVYYIIDKWLVNFPYRIDIHWWVFALALLMVLALTVVVSVTQTLRAACENPVNAIKSN